MGLSVFGVAGIGLCVVGLILGIVATAIPQWLTASVGNIDIKLGLWKYCVSGTCSDLFDSNALSDDDENDIKAVRAFMIIGIILSAVAAVPAVLVMVMKQNKMLYFAAAGVAGGAGLAFMIAFAIVADELKTDALDYGAAFALCIVAWILHCVAAAVFAVAKVMDKD